jgi:hypothetical protein
MNGAIYQERIKLLPTVGIVIPIALAFLLVVFSIYNLITLDDFLNSTWGMFNLVFAVICVILAIALSSLKLKITVTHEYLNVGLTKGRTIPMDEIHSVVKEDFSPMKDYLGWGLRVGRKGVGYIAAGTKDGLRINLSVGKSFFISSKRTFEFENAMNAALKAKKNSSGLE